MVKKLVQVFNQNVWVKFLVTVGGLYNAYEVFLPFCKELYLKILAMENFLSAMVVVKGLITIGVFLFFFYYLFFLSKQYYEQGIQNKVMDIKLKMLNNSRLMGVPFDAKKEIRKQLTPKEIKLAVKKGWLLDETGILP